MASTFGGLNIAGSGLRAANASLNTTVYKFYNINEFIDWFNNL